MIKEEDEEETTGAGGYDQDQRRRLPDVFKESDELETLGSLERDLPVELSFLIRQQAYCMAKMNYLDRQIRELKETSKQTNTISSNNPTATSSRVGPSSSYQSNQHLQQQHLHHYHHQNQLNLNQRANLAINGIPSTTNTTITNNIPIHCNNNHFAMATNPNNATTSTMNKNGNFIPSDDSGGEYSRATISDDDELSSLLDQIAKSVKPIDNLSNNQQLHQMQIPQIPIQGAQYNVITTNHHQPFAIYSPSPLNQTHHQAVPVFVMGSPLTATPSNHPSSSISSTILPGVHFQPEPRYNQYYADDFFVHQNPLSANMMMNTSSSSRHNSGLAVSGRSRQFDSSISAIERLVSQKEKRQIKSQLKSADNWLKMRASGLCSNLNDFNIPSTSSISGAGNTLVSANAMTNSDNMAQMTAGGSLVDRNTRTLATAPVNQDTSSNSVNDLNQQQVTAGRSR